MPTWKVIVLRSFGFGAGFALTLSLVVCLWVWQKNRPRPPKPWNTTALVALEPPGFSMNSDGKTLELVYSVKNNTNVDYKLDDESAKQLRKMIRLNNGELSPPFENKGLEFEYAPIFIPAGQRGTVGVSLEFSALPHQRKGEADADFHERVRMYLEMTYPNYSGLVFYDEVNRYQINFPKWADKKPTS
jgi:hypothetical protein